MDKRKRQMDTTQGALADLLPTYLFSGLHLTFQYAEMYTQIELTRFFPAVLGTEGSPRDALKANQQMDN